MQSIGKRSFHGEKETTFAQLYFKRQDLTLMVRKEDLEGTVRNPIDAKEATRLLAHLRQWKGKVSTQWKTRANAHHAALDRGDPFECAEVYKGLKILDSEGGLRASDRAHLNQSLDFLTEEVANALGQSRDKTREQIVSM